MGRRPPPGRRPRPRRAGGGADAVRGGGGGVSVRLAGGQVVRGRVAVLAVDPRAACTLLGLPADAPLARRTADLVPVLAAAGDVLQDAYVRGSRGDRAEVGSPRAYLSSIVTRLCIDRRQAIEARK